MIEAGLYKFEDLLECLLLSSEVRCRGERVEGEMRTGAS